jgi:hypothetical protein
MNELVSRVLVPPDHPAIKSAILFLNRYPTNDISISTKNKRPGLSLSFERHVTQILEHNISIVPLLQSARDELTCELVYSFCSVEISNNGRFWMPATRNSSESVNNFDNVNEAFNHYQIHFADQIHFAKESCCHCTQEKNPGFNKVF